MLDPTKLIPEEEVPVRRVGRLVLDRVVDNFFAETEQVAFCTQNIVPGIDFTNDPLLQGRNFSYLDTQLKRLGSPNFTHLPVNAPKCPFAHFQQDGHMAMANPQGRVNYEPNSWDPTGGPREDPAAASAPSRTARATRPDPSGGCGRRASPTTTARPGSSSSARPRSSSGTSSTRSSSSSASATGRRSGPGWWPGCATSDDDLADTVAEGLGLPELPDAAARRPEARRDLPPSPALSILANGPDSFAGRKIGILVTDGVDADKLAAA